jgi:hypothetical protein
VQILLVRPDASCHGPGGTPMMDRGWPSTSQFVPLPLATIAALTPAEHQVRIWDEEIQGSVQTQLQGAVDLVGLTGYGEALERAAQIGDACRARGIKVVMGGPGISADPYPAGDHLDSLFLGEAEVTWPAFLADLAAGRPAREYRAPAFSDLAQSPIPRWDNIADSLAERYFWGAAQINRGCPHRCEFCNVWIDFGRVIRHKPIPQVLQELANLRDLGMRRIILSSDNFMGDPRYAKALLEALIPFNHQGTPLAFVTETTIKGAQSDELLRLHADAGFTTLGIGLETPNRDSLKETRKYHNTKQDLVSDCRRISAHGMAVLGSLVVGFDQDGPDIFDRQFTFIQDALLVTPSLNLLKAIKGTDLYRRMQREGRLVPLSRLFPGQRLDEAKAQCNIVPAGMSRRQLYMGFLDLHERVWDWTNFRDRAVAFIDNVSYLPAPAAKPQALSAAHQLVDKMRKMPQADAATIDHILDYTLAKAPALVQRMVGLTMGQCMEAAALPRLRSALLHQIELERDWEDAGGLATLAEAQ